MNPVILSIVFVAYLLLLFFIAFKAEGWKWKGRKITSLPLVYALSVSVFCTAWTFYGSLGSASTGSLNFLAVYLGPTIMAPLGFLLLKKLVRVCKLQQITSLADLISSRYGKNISLGSIVTVCCFIGIVPYLSLQLKAISESFRILGGYSFDYKGVDTIALVISFVLIGFTVLFGSRKTLTSEQHSGLLAAVAFESIVKLFVFLLAGLIISYLAWNSLSVGLNSDRIVSGFASFFKEKEHSTFNFGDWFWVALISGFASILLPRMFQINVVENDSEHNLTHSVWVFPFYLLLINIFVLPIAYAGYLFLGNNTITDYTLLLLPLKYNLPWLAVFVFIGGISAATSMVIVETIALSTMFSNSLVIPFLARQANSNSKISSIGNSTLFIRKFGVFFTILSAYLYYEFVSHYTSLISIGLISFVSVAQFAPSVFGGLYWKSGNKYGALSGIIIGFVVWFFTLIVPSLAQNNILSRDIIDYGLFHLAWLKPNSLFGLDGWGSIAHASFWSLLFNFGCYIVVSVWTNQTEEEKAQAELFVDIFKYSEVYESSVVYKGVAYIPDVKALLANFVGDVRANNLINAFSKRHKIENDISAKADPRMVAFVERTLSGIVGSASSRLMVATVVKEEEVSVQELMGVLKESQSLIALNNELKRKTIELNNTKSDLEDTNRKLIQLDELKDDFLTTVTHELRTPITSIRAFSEILYDNPDMEIEDRQHYTNIITRETERITRLIAQVLDLEKYESGRQKLHLTRFDLYDVVISVIEGMQQLVAEKQININVTEFSHLVIADEDKITQVLINLISNAVKFVPQNTGEISIECSLVSGMINLVVSDNGKGIDPQFHELIFDKFYQAENQTIRKPKGSGLGLAICKKIMQLHGGDISLRSILGQGSEFTIIFPINREV